MQHNLLKYEQERWCRWLSLDVEDARPQSRRNCGRVVGYQDFIADDEKDWIIDSPFVRDASALKAQFGVFEAKGGGDEPESLLDALFIVAKAEACERGEAESDLKWRARGTAARVVFTDASYHPTMSIPLASGGKATDAKNAMVQAKIRLSVFAPELPCYDELSDLPHSEFTLIPLNGSSPIEALEAFTREKANFKRTLEQLAKSVTQSSYDIPVAG